jgi:hypothetical protein
MSRGRSTAMTAREISWREALWRAGCVAGGIVGYGSFAAFLALVGFQTYRWFEDGEWTHIGVNGALRAALAHLGRPEDLGGRMGALAHWLDAPVTWLGLHRLLDLLPASLALFALAILGNFVFIYASDHLRDARGADGARLDDQRVERGPEQATKTPSAM